MEEEGQFDWRMKLELLRNMLPVYRLYLVPSRIVPHLGQLLGGVEGLKRREILDKENAGKRDEAVDMLMKIVLDKKEEGVNLFLHVLENQEGQFSRFLTHFEAESGDRNNEMANEYFSFIIGLLEGQIIEMLTDGEFYEALICLFANDVIGDIDMDQINCTLEQKGRHHAALQMFSFMSSRTADWPRQFLFVLRSVKPDLLFKIDPCDQDPFIPKEEIAAGASAAGAYGASTSGGSSSNTKDREDDEQTCVKEPLRRQEGAAHPVKTERVVLQMDTQEAGAVGGATANSSDSSDSDDFSDDESKEKQNYESSEKHHNRDTTQGSEDQRVRSPRDHKPKQLTLRKYQEELAVHALAGHNTIICAPTGSGKTRVALHIVQQHLQSSDKKKIVFLARTGPLVAQQYKTFTKYMPNVPAVLVTGESEHSQNLHGLMPTYNIFVLTPKILENHLTPEKIPSLEAFSLIIFDECHHTRKGEPYNSVMKSYLKSKKDPSVHLPQIVGLTASIGVEKATTVEKAKESILGVMGNLDVKLISTVKENLEELMATVPRPEERLVPLSPREGDDISEQICQTMNKLEDLLEKSAGRVVGDMEVEEAKRILAKRPGERREQKYSQWAVILRNQVRLLTIPDNPDDKMIERRRTFKHEIHILTEALIAYNEALDVHELTRPQDVLEYLQQKFLFQRIYTPPEVDTTFLEHTVGEFFSVLEKTLKKTFNPNPNLDTLAQTILQHLADKEGEQSHIIIFVRTRATCQALCNWLNSEDVDRCLRGLNASPFTGTGAHQDQGGMTQNEQEAVIQKFREGSVKLIVSTSVGEEGIDIPECNLTIKYNHVGNEVTTVQTRGRSRKHGGQSILLAMPQIILQEHVNRQREEYMKKAIQLIINMRPADIARHIMGVQRKTLEAEEIEEVGRKVKKMTRRKGKFSLACCQCSKVRVDGSQIRKIQDAHRVIVGHSMDDKVTIHLGKNPRCFDEMEFRGSVICRCKNRLGQILIYKGVKFMTLGIKYWVVMDDRDRPATFKKWKDLPYAIEELSAADIKEHLKEHLNVTEDTSDEDFD